MKMIPFDIVDVFAEERYQGNQLAVFRHAAGLTPEDMQRIAKETNFAETTFIISGESVHGGYDVRIFTPDTEVPFAGHPTLGTAYILRREYGHEQTDQLLLNLKVGQIPVTFEAGGEIWMQQKPPQFGRTVDRETICGILNLQPEDMADGYPIQEVSTGLPSLIVPLTSLAAVRKCRIHPEKYSWFLKEQFGANILVFSTETYNKANDLNVRVFCDDSGYPEDAATGSANGNLAGYLLKHHFLNRQRLAYRVEQGYEMQRKSLILVRASGDGAGMDIRVGGQVFPVARGEWLVE
ncbi:PhzF family phenazine biosynthesis protein [Paenibacillus sp. JX-17]|uniref:PhzF family phenazine biosynthesis protein n=1 Tax=Paenibacillus lacisoli TaxID=3064525 RepID=A0ABT9CJA2_9BACL|nr:PhzF family phenazine biosynthesis protein [Paenibacillus sp. JX-17]MDO7907751.1 PhzF family phenazine biosynthesis protein [Paenibacillus sp. JX-17]